MKGSVSLMNNIINIDTYFKPNICDVIKIVLEMGIKTLNVFEKVLVDMAKAFDIISHSESITDIGDKVIQAEEAGIICEDFETYEEYIAAIENFDIDLDKSKTIDDKDKLIRGLEMIVTGIENKFNDIPIFELAFIIPISVPMFATNIYLKVLIEIIKNNPDVVIPLVKYLSDKPAKDEEISLAFNTLTKIIMEADHGISEENAGYKAINLRGCKDIN